MIEPTPALLAPITNRAEAEAFMRELVRLRLDFHFDDGAVDCLFGNGRVTKLAAVAIDDQVALCYAAWEASGADLQHDCPIGYMLKLTADTDVKQQVLQYFYDNGFIPDPNPDDYDDKQVQRMLRFLRDGQHLTAFITHEGE